MRIRFWGTRGSLPSPISGAEIEGKILKALTQANGRVFANEREIKEFIASELDFSIRSHFGGNSSCVQLDTGEDAYFICDMGSGLREFGQHIMRSFGPGNPKTYNIFMSHVHWDHIMGLPFFPSAYIPGNTLRIHGCHTVVEEALRKQQSDPCFPVPFDALGANIEFVKLEPDQTYEIDGLTVRPILQPHHGDSYGYRFEKNGKTVVYSTDGEHKLESQAATDAMIEFFRNADLVIFDAMYSMAEMVTMKEDWGHSSNIIGVDLCIRAGVKHYCMFHHEPICDDTALQSILQETIRYEEIIRDGPALKISSAYDGLEVEL
jgi:phosphoribosyl 1,2-cyclic phosphodiesterase